MNEQIEPQPSRYQDALESLAAESRLRLGVFAPEPADMAYVEACRRALPELTVAVVAVDRPLLCSGERVERQLLDVLLVPDLQRVSPWHICHLEHFLTKGGRLIVGSADFLALGQPFAEMAVGDQPRLGEMDMAVRISGPLGIKPYVTDIEPCELRLNTRLLPSLPAVIAPYHSTPGLYLNSSTRAPLPVPRYGSVFAQRLPDANIQVLATGCDEFGTPLTSVAVLAQRWRSGGALLAVAGTGPASLLDPVSPSGAAFLRDALRLMVGSVRITAVTSSLPVYRDDERPELSCIITSNERRTVQVRIAVSSAGSEVWSRVEDKELDPGVPCCPRWVLDRGDLAGDVFNFTVTVSDCEGVLVEARNGFIVWDEAVARGGPAVAVAGRYLSIDGKGRALNGTNYYESHLGETMWVMPNIADLNDDLQRMEAAAINYIRIHYHHPAWFTEHYEAIGEAVPEPYRGIPREPIAPDYYWRVFDAHVYLCQKYGIVYGGDLFTLVGKAMGDPRGWFGGLQDVIQNPVKRAAQKEFTAKLAARYCEVPGIAWDLWNEPTVPNEELPVLREWAAEIRAVFRAQGDRHPITIGTFDPVRYDDVTDFYAGHGHARRLAEVAADTPKPQIFQEVWMDRPPTPRGEREQCQDLLGGLLATYGHGFAGFAPWQWTQQARLWNTFLVTQWEIWDDWLGACRRNDGTEKPAGRAYRRFSQLLASREFLEFDRNRQAIRTDLGWLMFQLGNDKQRPAITLTNERGKPLAGLADGELSLENGIVVRTEPAVPIWFQIGGSAAGPVLALSIEGATCLSIRGVAVPAITVGEWPAGTPDLPFPSGLRIPEPTGLHLNLPSRLSSWWLRLALKVGAGGADAGAQ